MRNKDAEAVSKVAAADRRAGILKVAILFVAVIVSLLLGAYLILDYNTRTSRDNVYTMNAQLCKSVETRFEMLEIVSSRVFLRKDYVRYDASDIDRSDPYEALRLEQEIDEYFDSLSTVDNYNDFFLLYANNHTVGRVSKATNEAFGNNMYQKVNDCLKNKKSAWITGVNDDYGRLYFVRSINPSAVFVGSMLTNELKTIFPDNLTKHLSFALVDDNGKIIFSVNQNSITQDAVKKLNNEWSESEPVTIDSLKYAASSAECCDSWHVVSVTDFTFRNMRYLRIFLYCLAIVAGSAIVVMIVGFLLSSSRDPDNVIYRGGYSSNSVDRLTGLVMNEALENLIVQKLDRCINGATMALMLVKIKNYDLISENYGGNTADEAILKVWGVLRDFYGKNNTVGKTGENEFAVLADFTDFNLFKAHDRMKANARQLEEELDKLELDNERGMIRCAVGAAIYPDDSDDYDELYDNAKTALADSEKLRACKCRFFKDITADTDKK